MSLEPAFVYAALQFGVARVVEEVDHVELLVPLLLELLGRKLEAEPVDLADLAPVVGAVELRDRLELTRVLGEPVPEEVVEVARHAREHAARVALQYLERVDGRAVVVEIERDEANRGVLAGRPGRDRLADVAEYELCACQAGA